MSQQNVQQPIQSLFGNSNAYQQQMTNSGPGSLFSNVQQPIPINNLSNMAPYQQMQYQQYPIPPQYGNAGLFGFPQPKPEPAQTYNDDEKII